MSNATALRTVLEHVREHQGDWDQGNWSNCFAGQTLRVLAGATEFTHVCRCCGGLAVGDDRLYSSSIGVRAAQLLDLTPEQAVRLFHADNSLATLATLIEEFTAEMALAA